MRILIAHEALAGGGGVESYLFALVPALAARGHEVGFLHDNPAREPGPVSLRWPGVPTFGVADEGLGAAMSRAANWRPAVCFSHNMRHLAVERALTSAFPTVKMMHGYFGTCISGQKAHSFPSVTACDRAFGPMCLALYLPRQCGRRVPSAMFSGYAWSSAQRTLFARYAHVVVASEHMGREYRRAGVASSRLTVAPLFPAGADADGASRAEPAVPTVLFAGRMTRLKGGDVLVHAVADASARLRKPVRLVFAGDGPERARWQALAAQLGVEAVFTGWLGQDALAARLRGTSVVAVPSLWPEPFGLVGLEAGVHGVPAVAFASGGIAAWLRHDVNGLLVPGAGDPAALGAAMAAILGDRALADRLGAGATRVAAELSLEAHLDRIEAVLMAAAA